jgi:hypothetical protein
MKEAASVGGLFHVQPHQAPSCGGTLARDHHLVAEHGDGRQIARRGSLCEANNVPLVMVKSFLQPLQRIVPKLLIARTRCILASSTGYCPHQPGTIFCNLDINSGHEYLSDI